MSTEPVVVLGSQSPRRRDLLSLLVDPRRIVVRPPGDADELSFDGLDDRAAVFERLARIAGDKADDVLANSAEPGCVLAADTVVIANRDDGSPVVLGKPPEGDWREHVRQWFREFYFGRTHTVATSVVFASTWSPARFETTVRTEVRFRTVDDEVLEWYLDTGEPVGKAGGYGLQGAGSLFVERIEGSPSNVIGLPLAETREGLAGLVPELFAGE